MKEVEDSLRRLQTDVIDAIAMADLYRAGKIRAIGVSNFRPSQMDEFRAVAPLHTAQPPYDLFERAIEVTRMP